jgi:hypothetical protein
MLQQLTQTSEKEIISFRKLFEDSAVNTSSANNFYQQTRKINEQSASTLIGFKATSELMMCNHVFSPLSKLSYFNSGKKLLETAIQKDPKNIELRFFRFSTQSNVPALLNYSSNINEDKMILMNYLKINNSITDKDLYQRIKSYMLKSTYCSASEKQQLTTT